MTVARFRQFVAAYESWHAAGKPENDDGANPNVPGSGWSTTWTSLPTNAAQLKNSVSCSSTNGTWLDGAGNDSLPMNCVNWYTSFAFCIWDGGRLPTESEWEYAAAGGSNNYLYPWGDLPVPSNAQDSTAAYATYRCLGDGSAPTSCTFADILPVGSKPLGQGLYGQRDLAGSVYEWTLDWFASYPTSPSTNYAKVDAGTQRVFRGGDWGNSTNDLQLTTTAREIMGMLLPWGINNLGLRCARNP